MKLLIIGGVAGGASAATRARRLSEDAEIVVLECGPDVSFANCGMPYHIGDEIRERSKLLVTTPRQLRRRFKLDVRVRSEVISIDRVAKKVRVRDLALGREYEEIYDKLLIATGAAPIRPPLPGVDLPGIYMLRNLQDMDRIRSAVDAGAKQAIVIGGGFMGLELVENFVRRGIGTSLVELQSQVLPPLDAEMTAPLLETLEHHAVQVFLSNSVEGFNPAPGGRISVHLKSGRHLSADLVVVGVGVRPESKLAADAGLELGTRGGIRVNDHLQTSDPDVYAVGDVIEVTDFVLQEPTQIPLAGPANRQGRIAADNIFGRSQRYRGSQGTAIVRVFDCVAAMTGASEKLLRRNDRSYRAVYVHPGHHAGYYPGAEAMTIKLVFAPVDGRILGAQAVGGAGVDKRIDVLAAAIQARMSVFDLEEMELAYAPQFGSAKDPVNMAGFVAAGAMRGDHPQIGVESLDEENEALILDVRSHEEFTVGAIPGAMNLPIDELRARLGEVPNSRRVVAYCQVGQRGYLATRILLQAGYDVVNLSGGYKTFKMHTKANRPSVMQ